MKLVAWNCQGAFRKKAGLIAEYAPDIAVISECEHPDRLRFDSGIKPPTACLWFGDSPTKGIGIFSYTGVNLKLHRSYQPAIRYCIPIVATGRLNLKLVAIWAMHHKNRQLSYVGQIYRALEAYRRFIRQDETILMGDWNSNTQWDTNSRIGNHSQVVAQLAVDHIVSVYHTYFQEAFGDETVSTLYMQRKREKGYHVDYCFVPQAWIKRLTFFSVGSFEAWSSLSDHSPLFAEFRQ